MLLKVFLIFSRFQPSVAYKSVAYKKEACIHNQEIYKLATWYEPVVYFIKNIFIKMLFINLFYRKLQSVLTICV